MPLNPMIRALPSLMLVCGNLASAAEIWFSGPQEIEATAEVLAASDLLIQSYNLNYSGTEGLWTLEAGLGLNDYQLDYAPVLFGSREKLDEQTLQTSIGLTRKWNEEWSTSLRFRAYEGFSDYRSIWISEFYRQFFGAFPGYYAPDPHGTSFGLSTRWDYLPGTGSATFAIDLGRDEIAPGWSFNPALGQPEADRDTLDTVSGSLRVEHALNPWLKSGLELTARQTSEREPRFGIRSSWAAVSGPVSFRLSGGYSSEAPSFDALHGSAVVEWNFIPEWSAYLGYRVYQDSGEIESSGFNALAPALDSTEIFTGVRWHRKDLTISGGVGLLDSDYETLTEDNLFFGNLYRDREWWTFRLATSFQF